MRADIASKDCNCTIRALEGIIRVVEVEFPAREMTMKRARGGMQDAEGGSDPVRFGRTAFVGLWGREVPSVRKTRSLGQYRRASSTE